MTVELLFRPPRAVLRRDAGNWSLETALHRRGLGPVAGVDEAGRGACAGPLVIASCVLRPGDASRLEGLTDSKLMTAAARDRMFDLVRARAVDYAVVVVPPAEVDLMGVHVANIEGMRRAVARLATHPGYVLVDGFRVPGLTAPSIPVLKGD
ncbi:MAG: ribonuclease HII, partial [Actinomycetota bacterium]|nr:ribonuclease HII [Actinomycetota bacterium]